MIMSASYKALGLNLRNTSRIELEYVAAYYEDFWALFERAEFGSFPDGSSPILLPISDCQLTPSRKSWEVPSTII